MEDRAHEQMDTETAKTAAGVANRSKQALEKWKKAELREKQRVNSKDIKSKFPPLKRTSPWGKRPATKDRGVSASPIRSNPSRDPVFELNNEINSPFFLDIVRDIDTTKDADLRIVHRLASRRSTTSWQSGMPKSARQACPSYYESVAPHDLVQSEVNFPPRYLLSLSQGKGH